MRIAWQSASRCTPRSPTGSSRKRGAARPSAGRMPGETRQAPPLASRAIEIAGIEPTLKCRLQGRPFAVEDREPAGVAVAPFVERGLPEHPFVAEAQALRRGARGRVE